MCRKLVMVAIVALTVGGTSGYVAFGQPLPPKRYLVEDLYQAPKPAKKWRYLTLTEVRKNTKDDSCDVFVASGGVTKICGRGWIEAGESLGMKLAAEHPRNNSASYRASVLDLLGETGWELTSVHKTEAGWLAWVFKREI